MNAKYIETSLGVLGVMIVNSPLLLWPTRIESAHNDNFQNYSYQALARLHSPTHGYERFLVCHHNSHREQYDAQQQHFPL